MIIKKKKSMQLKVKTQKQNKISFIQGSVAAILY